MASLKPDLLPQDVVLTSEDAAAKFPTPKNPEFPYGLVYTALHRYGANAFRIVRLLPGSGNDAIKCELIPSSLSPKAPSYEALSYCAGDPNDFESITLNGHKFNTFQSTFEALCRFRCTEDFRDLWIDQICINQTDIEERDSQVLLMRNIYKHAIRTQIWLGEAAENPPSILAFDLLDDFLRTNRADLRAYIMKVGAAQPGYKFTGDSLRDYLHAEDEWHTYYQPLQVCQRETRQGEGLRDDTLNTVMQWFRTACSDPNYVRSWHAFFGLFDRPWWRRCWIVQEAAVSGEMIVNCGLKAAAWEDLCLLLEAEFVIGEQIWITPVSHDDELLRSISSCYDLQYGISVFRRASKALTLEGYLRVLRKSLASEPRDKVYSILGMLTDCQRREYAIVPSYATSNTTAEVYFTAAEAILSRDLDLRLLTDTSARELEFGLPTWVPDWYHPVLTPAGDFYSLYDAGTDRPAQVEVLKVRRELKLRGCRVDSIQVIGPSDDGGDGTETMAAWAALFAGRSQPANDLCELDSFYRTLGLNRWISVPDPNGAPEDFRSGWREKMDDYSEHTERLSMGWRFFISGNASPGMASKNAELGDTVFIPWGSKMPFAVRRSGERADRYQLIGPCYLHGMMYGEVVSLEKEGKLKSEVIYLV
jgi:hypothetical protein